MRVAATPCVRGTSRNGIRCEGTTLKQLGLLLLGAIFVTGGWQQVQEPHPRAQRARDLGLPVSDELVRASGWAMIVGAATLHITPLRRLAALTRALQLT